MIKSGDTSPRNQKSLLTAFSNFRKIQQDITIKKRKSPFKKRLTINVEKSDFN